MATISLDVEFATISCGCCGGVYAITERFRSKCQEDAKSWHCPYCNVGWGFAAGKTEAQRVREQLAAKELELQRERQKLDQARAEANHQFDMRRATERQLSAQKGVTTRLKNRVKNGICPCCNRHFENLERHMKGQHPEYAAPATAEI